MSRAFKRQEATIGLFSFVGGLIGGGKAKGASRKAEAAQLQYLSQALGEQRRQFDLTREDYAPYLGAGTAALGQQGDLVGLNGSGVQASAIEALRSSPLFQSLFNTGQEAILQNASATGGIRGGNTQRGLADFGADTLAQVIERQLAQLGGISGRGQQAVGDVSSFGANKAAQVASLLGQQGQVRAGGLLTRGGINAGIWNNAGSFLDEVMSKIAAGMGGGATPGFGRGF